jgi:hypothetical protein
MSTSEDLVTLAEDLRKDAEKLRQARGSVEALAAMTGGVAAYRSAAAICGLLERQNALLEELSSLQRAPGGGGRG